MTSSAEVVVIGGGIEGCSAARSLADRGVTDVVIVERDTVGSGGTGKSSGVVRCPTASPASPPWPPAALSRAERGCARLRLEL